MLLLQQLNPMVVDVLKVNIRLLMLCSVCMGRNQYRIMLKVLVKKTG